MDSNRWQLHVNSFQSGQNASGLPTGRSFTGETNIVSSCPPKFHSRGRISTVWYSINGSICLDLHHRMYMFEVQLRICGHILALMLCRLVLIAFIHIFLDLHHQMYMFKIQRWIYDHKLLLMLCRLVLIASIPAVVCPAHRARVLKREYNRSWQDNFE